MMMIHIIGEINCNYYFISKDEIKKILGDEFNKFSKFDIFIDGKKMKYSKTYKLLNNKIYNISFKLYENINMDYYV